MRRHAEKNIALVLSALPATQHEVAQRTGLAQSTVSRNMAVLVAREEAYLSSYTRPSGPTYNFTAIYSPGKAPRGFTAKVPDRMTQAERTAKYRKRARKDGTWEDVLAQQRSYHWRTRTPQRDALTTAFYGAYDAANYRQQDH